MSDTFLTSSTTPASSFHNVVCERTARTATSPFHVHSVAAIVHSAGVTGRVHRGVQHICDARVCRQTFT